MTPAPEMQLFPAAALVLLWVLNWAGASGQLIPAPCGRRDWDLWVQALLSFLAAWRGGGRVREHRLQAKAVSPSWRSPRTPLPCLRAL